MVGNKIKELRKEKKITQKKLAEEIKCHQTMITRWEKNQCEPTATNIVLLCDYFNVSADYLLGRTDY